MFICNWTCKPEGAADKSPVSQLLPGGKNILIALGLCTQAFIAVQYHGFDNYYNNSSCTLLFLIHSYISSCKSLGKNNFIVGKQISVDWPLNVESIFKWHRCLMILLISFTLIYSKIWWLRKRLGTGKGRHQGCVFHKKGECQGLVSCSTVKSGNFVTFFTQNIFFTKFHEGNTYFFSCRKFIKKFL